MATSIEQILETFHSRKLLLYPSFNHSSASITPHPGPHHLLEPSARENSFDAKIVMVLSVLLCALICSLGLNSIIRCVMRCSRFVSSDDESSNGNNAISGKIANTGIKKQALKTFPVVSYSTDPKIPGLESECVICLQDFFTGEKIKILPKCNHGFHVKCIDKWLNCHSSCPTCRHCLIETCQKIVGCTTTPQSSSNVSLPGPFQEIIISIAPLEPEGIIFNYHS
ncbi:hypothetical protein LIER_41511 [Lithospermum erythrorhizon]|uniref:RING-type E3 ubiquitin transferase n=1 Tax=Lithospermum erythrorhizon TaxID=34254 RepID=A0AAV3RG84_LITER